ncbi:MAG TPA: hypothetical protein VFV70_06630 [Hyphomonadaceae bacterium]|nr:hypothetical protein [Hyphomonadaceae bacterium]
MAAQPLTPGQKRFQRRRQVVVLVASLIFIAVVFAAAPLFRDLLPDRPPRLEDMLALIAGFGMLQMALVTVLANSATPKDMPMPRRALSQVFSCFVGAAALFLPILGQRLIDPVVNLAIILVLTALSLLITWRVWRAADELMRSLMKDTYVACYFVIITALCVYAPGERLGLFSGVTAWGALGFSTLITFVCTTLVAMRRGLDRPPLDE